MALKEPLSTGLHQFQLQQARPWLLLQSDQPVSARPGSFQPKMRSEEALDIDGNPLVPIDTSMSADVIAAAAVQSLSQGKKQWHDVAETSGEHHCEQL